MLPDPVDAVAQGFCAQRRAYLAQRRAYLMIEIAVAEAYLIHCASVRPEERTTICARSRASLTPGSRL